MKNQKNLHFDSSKKFEIFSQISEKISQLGDLKRTLDHMVFLFWYEDTDISVI